jgi:opine dehydrogenase
MRVAVLGTGGIGLGAAALLKTNGHAPVLWSPSGRGAAELAAAADLRAEGALTGPYAIAVAPTCQEALDGADAAFLALPANGHRAVMDAALPHLAPGQTVIISGHLSFGALYLAHGLAGRGVRAPIVVWGTTVTTGRRTGPTSVRISNIRAKVDVASLPADASEAGLATCRALFGDRFVPRDDMIAIALSNLNPQNHLAIALCNLTRMERGETWFQYANTTDAVGRLIEALDAERLAIADAFGVRVRTAREHFHLSFGAEPGPIGAMARELAGKGDNQAPATLQTRYVLEDAPFGLHCTALLGRLAGRPATLHEAGVAMLSALYGRDLAADNDLLPAIGFADLSMDGLRALARDGWPA